MYADSVVSVTEPISEKIGSIYVSSNMKDLASLKSAIASIGLNFRFHGSPEGPVRIT